MISLISKMNLILLLKGISKTIQRGDMGKYGQHFMIAPMTNEVVINQQTCFTLNGTEGDEVGPQHALPDVSKFEVIRLIYFFLFFFKLTLLSVMEMFELKSLNFYNDDM